MPNPGQVSDTAQERCQAKDGQGTRPTDAPRDRKKPDRPKGKNQEGKAGGFHLTGLMNSHSR